MSGEDIDQSVIINYSENFSNGEPSNFVQSFNKMLEIPPNSSVALYSAELQRQPIVVEPAEGDLEDILIVKPNEIHVQINNHGAVQLDNIQAMNPNREYLNQTDNANVNLIWNYPAIAPAPTTIPYGSHTTTTNAFAYPRLIKNNILAGKYSIPNFIAMFAQALSNNSYISSYTAAEAIAANIGLANCNFPYSGLGVNDEKGVYTGLVLNVAPVPIEAIVDLDATMTSNYVTKNNIIYDVDLKTITPSSTVDCSGSYRTVYVGRFPLFSAPRLSKTYDFSLNSEVFATFQPLLRIPATNPDPQEDKIACMGFMNNCIQTGMWKEPNNLANTGALEINTTVNADGNRQGVFDYSIVPEWGEIPITYLTLVCKQKVSTTGAVFRDLGIFANGVWKSWNSAHKRVGNPIFNQLLNTSITSGNTPDAFVPNLFSDEMFLLKNVQIEEDTFNNQLKSLWPMIKVRWYSLKNNFEYRFGNAGVNNINAYNTATPKVYFQVIIGSDEYDNQPQVVYDSKDYEFAMPFDILSGGAMVECVSNPANVNNGNALKHNSNLGLQPYIYMRDCVSNTDFITNMTYVPHAQRDDDVAGTTEGTRLRRYLAVNHYYLNMGKNINDIISRGVATLDKRNPDRAQGTLSRNYNQLVAAPVFRPNLFPASRGPDAGINAIFADDCRYNIEIGNLPIRCFNSTDNENPIIGNERPIIYNTPSCLDGNISQITAPLINWNIVPPTLKYMKLNNKQSVLLNDLKVTIRRAKSNKLAEEITDAKLEIVIKHGNE